MAPGPLWLCIHEMAKLAKSTSTQQAETERTKFWTQSNSHLDKTTEKTYGKIAIHTSMETPYRRLKRKQENGWNNKWGINRAVQQTSLEHRLRLSTSQLQDWMARITHQERMTAYLNSQGSKAQMSIHQAFKNMVKYTRMSSFQPS